MRTSLLIGGAVILISIVACSARAQTLNVWPGVAPGSENWKQKETTVNDTPIGTVVFNVVTPTLTAFLPERAKSTGTGVIIAPGGAFVALAIDLERITDLEPLCRGDELVEEGRQQFFMDEDAAGRDAALQRCLPCP